MNMGTKPYRIGGGLLCLGGLVAAPTLYLACSSVPLTSLSISAIIIGITVFVLGAVRPGIAPEYAGILQDTMADNLERMMRGVGPDASAVYFPGEERGEKGKIVIKSRDSEVVVAAPGIYCIGMVQNMTGPGADEMENAARYLLCGVLEIADSVNLSIKDREVFIEVGGFKVPKNEGQYFRCVGSPVASVMAVLICEALHQPVKIKEEIWGKTKGHIVIEVLG